MKRLGILAAVFILAASLVSCSGKAGHDGSETPESTPRLEESQIEGSQDEKPAPAANSFTSMSPIAAKYGITNNNYPRIDGSTSVFQLVQDIHYAMYGKYDHKYKEAAKTVPAYRLLIEGERDLIFAPYASADVLALAERQGVTLEFFPVAAEALVFITSSENPAGNITAEQVGDIYLNYGINNWKELGGPDRELVPICRNADSGSQAEMDDLVLNNRPMHPGIRNNYVEMTMEGMLTLVAFYHYGGMDGKPTDSYALGYTLYTYLQNMSDMTGISESLKILSLDGVAPDAGNVTDGSYPLSTSYYAVVRSDLPQDHSARNVIRFLQSEDSDDGYFGWGNLIPKK